MSAKKSEAYDLHQDFPKNLDKSNQLILSGVFWIGAHRLVNFPKNQTFALKCKRFWREEELLLNVNQKSVNFLEFFTVKSDDNFLNKVENQILCINLASINNNKSNVIGALRIPIHQFYIAYKDLALAKRLRNAELPVFSIDSWVPIFGHNSEKLGEIECVLAMGTETQINKVKKSKGWEPEKATITNCCVVDVFSGNLEADSPSRTSSKMNKTNTNIRNNTSINVDKDASHSGSVNLLQSIYSSSPYVQVMRDCGEEIANPPRINMEIIMARDLPANASLNTKHNEKQCKANREKHLCTPLEEEPNTYVTFQAYVDNGLIVKTLEGMVVTTSVIEKSSNPTWNESFQFTVNPDYLRNKNKRFILKVWRKSPSLSGSRNIPTPIEDKIIGFVALDLTILQKSTYMCDWFNIVNSFGHSNGQLKLSAQCVKELYPASNDHDNKVDNLLNSFEADLSINNFNLSRAIKRKFTELEEISQRLRARLLDVANNTDYINELESTDEYTNEFELDLNTVACEEDCEIDYFNNRSQTIRNLHNPNP